MIISGVSASSSSSRSLPPAPSSLASSSSTHFLSLALLIPCHSLSTLLYQPYSTYIALSLLKSTSQLCLSPGISACPHSNCLSVICHVLFSLPYLMCNLSSSEDVCLALSSQLSLFKFHAWSRSSSSNFPIATKRFHSSK